MNQHDFLIALLVFLVAAVVAVPLARRGGLGAVLGYLLAGAAIGPFALRLVTDVESILHFSEFGVVLMMFVIGLELEPRKLWALRRSIFGYGGTQLAACALVIGAAAALAGAPWQVALVAGLGLALSSTAIALATLTERNLFGTPAGAASFGILLFQDIAAIPMIALLPLLATQGAEGAGTGAAGWLAAGKAVAVIGAVVAGGRYLVRPALRFIARTDMREMFTAFALLLVVGIALMMDAVGLSMALGTFLAGVLLADSEYRHALEADLEPFKGLLLGLFFMAVGMSIDFAVLARSPWLVLVLVAAFVVAKTVVLALLARYFSIARGQRLLFALLISQGGEFAFVVFGVAGGAGLLPREIEAVLVLVVALSMVATPLLLLAYDRLVAPRIGAGKARPDEVITPQRNPVLIAGFGRFGQIIGRLLYSQGVGVTVLDHDPDQIDFLRQYGFKVFYGDATRLDLLEAAGIADASILVVAIDSMEDSLALIDRVRERFPQLQIYARARHVSHVYQLKDRGVQLFEREMFEGSLMLGRRVLEGLGFDPGEARNVALRFRRHNIEAIDRFYPHYTDQKKLVSLARQARDELEEMFRQDREQRRQREEAEWM
ncbi:Glutathione-regulated potassium-efflux system antiporter [Cupriavidus taiwanensis]|uniref:Glutathione-regulated potassium-efflux system antiporter n=1 Tax=Cupriavidus taiwanensis TaxID=164546 RepID=A0A976AXJ1_9BURK|nr:glutathione-regulated potassium-efflux system protein KefC [Cupriavidus taiwanensis]SOZ58202.1 Glutathione-regulated potassium-efflux system antiporter [Cupriavidus taiwanensis]SOZ58864.1 Glutathione-regulated potassium-efflux system antiporter [Cupriavidus taiwanensis]SOZ62479.1 Glutathione-regulated potassium-efflux system antiporter [Cupriavidus taiwanensis]SOZ99248.1 Glutathione-regulated potassium-efflux system antiporter [Cupriavidus taiwanensis]SPA06141.1 Glutathione-regulated potass